MFFSSNNNSCVQLLKIKRCQRYLSWRLNKCRLYWHMPRFSMNITHEKFTKKGLKLLSKNYQIKEHQSNRFLMRLKHSDFAKHLRSNTAVPNIFFGYLAASTSDHFQQFIMAPNILFLILPNLCPINMKQTGQDLILKTLLFLLIFQLLG